MEVWERGYIAHRIRDANDYVRHVEYIRENPVEAKIEVRAEYYAYSSASAGFEMDPCPPELTGERIMLGR